MSSFTSHNFTYYAGAFTKQKDYLQNILMSLMYLSMLKERKSDKGQSIGTLTPTIYGTLEGNWFILITGIICFVFDLIYIYALRRVRKK